MDEFSDPLACLLRPQTSQNREQHVSSVVTAKVERIENDGTYRLRFFGMNPDEDSDDTSAPARVMMPMAGNGRGMHFFPERGDEVVVGFQDGDPNTPIILGAVWNRAAPPPNQAKESPDNNIRTIVSRSGHEVTFDDTRGSEKVTIRSHSGNVVELDDSAARTRITVSSRGGRRIVLDDAAPGSLSLRTTLCQITMRDTGTISIQAAAMIELNAPVVTIDGVPFLAHTHGVPTPVTPPVTPLP